MWFDFSKLIRGAVFADPPETPPPAGDPPPPKDNNTPPADGGGATPPDWRDREIAQKHRQLKERDATIADLQARLARAQEPPPTTPPPAATPPQEPPAATPPTRLKSEEQIRQEIDQAATTKAQTLIRNQEIENKFETAQRSGITEYGDKWQGAMNVLQSFGGLSDLDLEAVLNTDNPHQVLYAIGSDVQKLTELSKMSPARRFTEYVKLGLTKPKQNAKPSDTPPPVNRLDGRPSSPAAEELRDDLPDEDWYAIRAKQKQESKGRPWSVR